MGDCLVALVTDDLCGCCYIIFFFKQKTAYEMRISDWSSDVCSSDLSAGAPRWQRIGITTAAAWLRDDGLFRAGSAGGDAVVEIDDRAVIAARGVGGEEGDHLGNIVDLDQAAQWRVAFD